jgi:Lar family restriction alleviation protein
MTAPTNGGELLPCPFCGGEQCTTAPGAFTRWFAVCKACGATANSDDGEDQAIAAWNTRTPTAQVGAATDSGEGVRYETDDRGLFCKHCGLTALRHHAYVGKAGLYCTAYPTKPDAGKVIREFGARLAQVPDDTPDVAYCGVDMTHGEARKLRDAIASMSPAEGLVESELWEACADLTDVLEAETEGFTNEEWAALGSATLHAEDRIASLVRLTRARQNGSAGQASYRIEENGCA